MKPPKACRGDALLESRFRGERVVQVQRLVVAVTRANATMSSSVRSS